MFRRPPGSPPVRVVCCVLCCLVLLGAFCCRVLTTSVLLWRRLALSHVTHSIARLSLLVLVWVCRPDLISSCHVLRVSMHQRKLPSLLGLCVQLEVAGPSPNIVRVFSKLMVTPGGLRSSIFHILLCFLSCPLIGHKVSASLWFSLYLFLLFCLLVELTARPLLLDLVFCLVSFIFCRVSTRKNK